MVKRIAFAAVLSSIINLCCLLPISSLDTFGASACSASAVQCDSAGPRTACGTGAGVLCKSAATCRSLGCCWAPAPPSLASLPAAGLPSCFFSNAGPSTYALNGSLFRTGSEMKGTYALVQGTMPVLGADFPLVDFSSRRVAAGVVEVKISPAGVSRWEIPKDLFEFGHTASGGEDGPTDYVLELPSQALEFMVIRPGTDAAVFDTRGHRLVVKDQYLELSTTVPATTELYGLGERVPSTGLPLRRDGVPYTLWAKDTWAGYYDVNNYGAHGFHMGVDAQGRAHGVLLWNSNGADVGVTSTRLQYRVIGGVLDLFIMMGPTPADVMAQLTSVVGRPALVPFWALGFMQSNFHYRTVEESQEVVDRYLQAGIPLEVFVSDYTYMQNGRTFTFDATNYPPEKLKAFIDRLHANGQRWVPILHPAVKVQAGYEPYDTGIAAGVFVQDYTRTAPVLGNLWPGASFYPDFSSAITEGWWSRLLQKFWTITPYDGLWLDMGEPSSRCSKDMCSPIIPASLADRRHVLTMADGSPFDAKLVKRVLTEPSANMRIINFTLNMSGMREAGTPDLNDLLNQLTQAISDFAINLLGRQLLGQLFFGNPLFSWILELLGCPSMCSDVDRSVDAQAYARANPPYAINSYEGDTQARLPLNGKTVPVTSYLLDGTSMYDAHNLYGHSYLRATYRSLTRIAGKRPFILSRSTFVGSGAYTAHWTGDIASTWDSLRSSIPGILTNGLMGIPFLGADICGFSDHASEELCARWISVGAFYPFCRNHHSEGYQELYLWASVAAAGRAALAQRYSLLHYLYTSLFYASVTGSPVMRPLFFAAPSDPAARGNGQQWMTGDGLLVAPVMQQGATHVEAYLPQGTWFTLRDYTRIVSPGVRVTMRQGLTEPANAFVAGGHVIPLATPAMTTTQVKASKVRLVVAMSGGAPQILRVAHAGCIAGADVACGQMYVDDGEQLQPGGFRDNHLTFTALQEASRGYLAVLFGNNPLNPNASCSVLAPPVTISDVTILGSNRGSYFTVSRTTISNAAAIHPSEVGSAQTSNDINSGRHAGEPGQWTEIEQVTRHVDAGAHEYDSAAGADSQWAEGAMGHTYDPWHQQLNIRGLDIKLICPNGFLLSWY